jgi:murein DD-endopeptidase MepM/ murein hydrolase activator NlpD
VPLVLLVLALFLAPPQGCFRHPVEAPIIRPFEAPACRWCPGNRGLDYATTAGEPVRAAAPGDVSFAGVVAGRRWVTVTHAGDLRTSYGPLARVAVRAGQAVIGGQVLGWSSGVLHVGLRRGDAYIDPARLFGPPVRLRPRLVPLDRPAPPRPLPSCPATGRSPGPVR